MWSYVVPQIPAVERLRLSLIAGPALTTCLSTGLHRGDRSYHKPQRLHRGTVNPAVPFACLSTFSTVGTRTTNPSGQPTYACCMSMLHVLHVRPSGISCRHRSTAGHACTTGTIARLSCPPCVQPQIHRGACMYHGNGTSHVHLACRHRSTAGHSCTTGTIARLSTLRAATDPPRGMQYHGTDRAAVMSTLRACHAGPIFHRHTAGTEASSGRPHVRHTIGSHRSTCQRLACVAACGGPRDAVLDGRWLRHSPGCATEVFTPASTSARAIRTTSCTISARYAVWSIWIVCNVYV